MFINERTNSGPKSLELLPPKEKQKKIMLRNLIKKSMVLGRQHFFPIKAYNFKNLNLEYPKSKSSQIKDNWPLTAIQSQTIKLSCLYDININSLYSHP